MLALVARRIRATAAVVLGATLGMSATAHAQYDVLAEPCEAEPHFCAEAPIAFDAVEALPIEFDFDTGWVPPGSPLQVKIAAMLAANTRLSLRGALVSEWPHDDHAGALRLTAPGDPMGGLLGYHYGLVTSAQAKLGVSVGPLNFNWQGNIPYLPQIDFQAQQEIAFDAWGWEPGVVASSSTLPETVAWVDLSSVIGVSIPGLTGGFQLDVAVDLDVSWTNHRIALADADEADSVTVEGGDIVMADGESYTLGYDGAFAEIDVHPSGTVDYGGVLHLIPSIYVSILGQTWSIPIVDIPIPFDAAQLELDFEPRRVHVPLPDLKLPVEVIDFGEVPLGDEGFRSYPLKNEGELVAATTISTSDPAVFPSWEEAIDIKPDDDSWGTLRFVPTHAGEHTAELVVLSNDPDAPMHVVKLTGVGVANGDLLVPFPSEGTTTAGLIADSGCGCALERRSSGGGGWLLVLGALGLVRRRRR
jgi:MYXO-CTERM domain-containing protein